MAFKSFTVTVTVTREIIVKASAASAQEAEEHASRILRNDGEEVVRAKAVEDPAEDSSSSG